MSIAKVFIDIDVNTQRGQQQIAGLQRSLTTLNSITSTLNKNIHSQSSIANKLSNDLVNLSNSTGYWESSLVRTRTAASRLDESLRKGQVTMGQFFSARFRADSMEAASVLSLANQRVAALGTQFVGVTRSADGFRESIAMRPMEAFNSANAVATERLAIHRAMLHQATTSMINFGKNTQWAGRQLMVGFTVPLAIFGSSTMKTFKEIEMAGVRFKKVYGDIFTPPEEMEQNAENMQELAKEFTKYGIAVKDTLNLAAEAAAAGARNANLTDAVTQATRLATLGQMEQNEALETTTALQNAFRLSGQQLADAVNYLNMVENQTVVTLQDLSQAIPRVAPVIVGLGGNVQDLAAFMAAMQEGGVSAAQGANALKSGLGSLINPTEKASKSLAAMGININQIVSANRGDLMATVQAFGAALDTVSEFERQQALEELFGKYQYARLGALFANINKEGTQAARAIELANYSTQELAASAEKELSVITDAYSVQLAGAMERFKLAIAPIGEMFTKFLIPIVNFATKIAEAFNNLPEPIKNITAIGTVLIGIVIPAGTMFLGLLMNLIGTLTKFSSIIAIAFRGFMSGGIGGAMTAVSQALRYMSLEEINAANAAQQLGSATANANAALRMQVGSAGSAQVALQRLKATIDAVTASYMSAAQASFTANSRMANPYGPGLRAASFARGLNPLAAPPPGARMLPIIRRNTGDIVPGTGNTDTVPAMLTPGEFVVNKEATANNLETLQAINSGQQVQYRNKGGMIAGYRKGAQTERTFDKKQKVAPTAVHIIKPDIISPESITMPIIDDVSLSQLTRSFIEAPPVSGISDLAILLSNNVEDELKGGVINEKMRSSQVDANTLRRAIQATAAQQIDPFKLIQLSYGDDFVRELESIFQKLEGFVNDTSLNKTVRQKLSQNIQYTGFRMSRGTGLRARRLIAAEGRSAYSEYRGERRKRQAAIMLNDGRIFSYDERNISSNLGDFSVSQQGGRNFRLFNDFEEYSEWVNSQEREARIITPSRSTVIPTRIRLRNKGGYINSFGKNISKYSQGGGVVSPGRFYYGTRRSFGGKSQPPIVPSTSFEDETQFNETLRLYLSGQQSFGQSRAITSSRAASSTKSILDPKEIITHRTHFPDTKKEISDDYMSTIVSQRPNNLKIAFASAIHRSFKKLGISSPIEMVDDYWMDFPAWFNQLLKRPRGATSADGILAIEQMESLLKSGKPIKIGPGFGSADPAKIFSDLKARLQQENITFADTAGNGVVSIGSIMESISPAQRSPAGIYTASRETIQKIFNDPKLMKALSEEGYGIIQKDGRYFAVGPDGKESLIQYQSLIMANDGGLIEALNNGGIIKSFKTNNKNMSGFAPGGIVNKNRNFYGVQSSLSNQIMRTVQQRIIEGQQSRQTAAGAVREWVQASRDTIARFRSQNILQKAGAFSPLSRPVSGARGLLMPSQIIEKLKEGDFITTPSGGSSFTILTDLADSSEKVASRVLQHAANHPVMQQATAAGQYLGLDIKLLKDTVREARSVFKDRQGNPININQSTDEQIQDMLSYMPAETKNSYRSVSKDPEQIKYPSWVQRDSNGYPTGLGAYAIDMRDKIRYHHKDLVQKRKSIGTSIRDYVPVVLRSEFPKGTSAAIVSDIIPESEQQYMGRSVAHEREMIVGPNGAALRITSVKDIIVPAQPRYPSLRQLELEEKQKGLRRKNKELSKKEQKELDILQQKYLSPTKLQTMYPDRYAFEIVNINGKDYPQDYLKAKEYVVEVKTDPEEIGELPQNLPVFNLGGIVGLRRGSSRPSRIPITQSIERKFASSNVFDASRSSIVPGSGNTDTVASVVPAGAFVINKKSTNKYRDTLEQINSGKSVIGARKGFKIPRFSDGAQVPAMLTPGEYIIDKENVDSNLSLLHQINNGTLAANKGGYILGLVAGDIVPDPADPSRYRYEGENGTLSTQSFPTERLAREAYRQDNPNPRRRRFNMFGGGMGASMIGSSIGMGLMMYGQQMQQQAMQSGQESDAGALIANAGIGLSILHPLISMMPPQFVALTSTILALGGGVAALIISSKKANESLATFNSQMYGSAEKTMKIAKEMGRQTASQQIGIMQGLKTGEITEESFSQAQKFVSESSSGKQLLEDIRNIKRSGGDAIEALRNQLTRLIISGVISKEEANAIAIEIGSQLNDQQLAFMVNAEIKELIGPDGKKIEAGGILDILTEITPQFSQEELDQEAEKAFQKIKNRDFIKWGEGIGIKQMQEGFAALGADLGLVTKKQMEFLAYSQLIADTTSIERDVRAQIELQLKNGTISAKEYLETINKINSSTMTSSKYLNNFIDAQERSLSIESDQFKLQQSRQQIQFPGRETIQSPIDKYSVSNKGLLDAASAAISSSQNIATGLVTTGNQIITRGIQEYLAFNEKNKKILSAVASVPILGTSFALGNRLIKESVERLNPALADQVDISAQQKLINESVTTSFEEYAKSVNMSSDAVAMLLSLSKQFNTSDNAFGGSQFLTDVMSGKYSATSLNAFTTALTEVGQASFNPDTGKFEIEEGALENLGINQEEFSTFMSQLGLIEKYPTLQKKVIDVFIREEGDYKIDELNTQLASIESIPDYLQKYIGVDIERSATMGELGEIQMTGQAESAEKLQPFINLLNKMDPLRRGLVIPLILSGEIDEVKDLFRLLPGLDKLIDKFNKASTKKQKRESLTQIVAEMQVIDPMTQKPISLNELYGGSYTEYLEKLLKDQEIDLYKLDPMVITQEILFNPEINAIDQKLATLTAQLAELEGDNSYTAIVARAFVINKIAELTKQRADIITDLAGAALLETPPSSGGGGGETTLMQDLNKMLKDAQKWLKAMKDFLNKSNPDYKKFIAGPYAPEFLEYLSSQGDKAQKLIKQGNDAIMKAYRKFEEVQLTQMTSNAVMARAINPILVERQRSVLKQDLELSGRTGMTSRRMEAVRSLVGEEQYDAAARIRAISKKERTDDQKQALREFEKTQRQAIRLSRRQVVIEDRQNIRGSLVEERENLQSLNLLSQRGLSPQMQQDILGLGYSLDTLKNRKISKLIEDQLIRKQLQEVQNKIKETSDEFNKLRYITRQGIDSRMAEQINGLGLSMEALQKISEEGLIKLKNYFDLSQTFKGLTEGKNQILDIADSIKTTTMLSTKFNIVNPDTISFISNLKLPVDQLLKNKTAVEELAKAYERLSIQQRRAAYEARDPLVKEGEILDLRVRTMQQTISTYARNIIKPLEDSLTEIGERISAKQREIELMERTKEPYQDAIDALEKEKEALQEVHDKRIKALEKIERINERIAKQQRAQLSVASALSRGDIAGAAQAALEMQQQEASERASDARQALEDQNAKEMAAKDELIKQNRDAIEAIDKNIKAINLEIRSIQDEQYNKQQELNDAKKEQLKLEEKLYKLQLLQTINQVQQAMLESIRMGDAEAVKLYQEQLKSLLSIAGGSREEQESFFGDEGRGVINSIYNMGFIGKTPEELIDKEKEKDIDPEKINEQLKKFEEALKNTSDAIGSIDIDGILNTQVTAIGNALTTLTGAFSSAANSISASQGGKIIYGSGGGKGKKSVPQGEEPVEGAPITLDEDNTKIVQTVIGQGLGILGSILGKQLSQQEGALNLSGILNQFLSGMNTQFTTFLGTGGGGAASSPQTGVGTGTGAAGPEAAPGGATPGGAATTLSGVLSNFASGFQTSLNKFITEGNAISIIGSLNKFATNLQTTLDTTTLPLFTGAFTNVITAISTFGTKVAELATAIAKNVILYLEQIEQLRTEVIGAIQAKAEEVYGEIERRTTEAIGAIGSMVPVTVDPTASFYGGFVGMAFGGMVSYKGSRERAPGMAFGGMVSYKGSRERAPGMANGGIAGQYVPGTGMIDKVPALLTPGEFVVRKSVAKEYGPLLENLNGQLYPNIGRNLSTPKATPVSTRVMDNQPQTLVVNNVQPQSDSLGINRSAFPRQSIPMQITSLPDLPSSPRMSINLPMPQSAPAMPVFPPLNIQIPMAMPTFPRMDSPEPVIMSNTNNNANFYNQNNSSYYGINVNSSGNSSAEEIANVVVRKIRAIDDRKIRGVRM